MRYTDIHQVPKEHSVVCEETPLTDFFSPPKQL